MGLQILDPRFKSGWRLQKETPASWLVFLFADTDGDDRKSERKSPSPLGHSPCASRAFAKSQPPGPIGPGGWLFANARDAHGECPRGDGLFLSDFRSSPSVSAKRNTSQLAGVSFWRRHPDLNRGSRICSPMPYHLAKSPYMTPTGFEPVLPP